MLELWLWYARQASPELADSILDRIDQRIKRLADHPELAPRRVDIAQNARVLVVQRWLVLYEYDGGQVRIMKVVDSASDQSRIEWRE
jgi:toxin ParE1/3/4